MSETLETRMDELFEELAGKVRRCFSPSMRGHTRGRRLKAGPFRKAPLEIRIPELAVHPTGFLFRIDQLAALLTASDRIPAGSLRRILLLPEFYDVDGQVLVAALPDPETLVLYLSPIRLLLAGPDVRPVWRAGGDFLFEALFQFVEHPAATMHAGPTSRGSLFFLPSSAVFPDEIQRMQGIHDRFVLRHPLHAWGDDEHDPCS